MLDAWIIEEILRRERQRREEGSLLELPIGIPQDESEQEVREDGRDERGIAVIDFHV